MKSITITAAQLRALDACPSQRQLFKQKFPNGYTATSLEQFTSDCLSHKNFDYGWAVDHLLREAAQAECIKVHDAARAERIKVHDAALAECIKVRDAARAECIKVRDSIVDAAWVEYDKVRDAAWVEYDKAKIEAFANFYWKQQTGGILWYLTSFFRLQCSRLFGVSSY